MARAGVVLLDCAIQKCCRIDIVGFPAFYSEIKGKKPKAAPKQRQTLARRIRTLANKDIIAATLLAAHGKIFTEIETELRLYYWAKSELDRIKSGRKTKIQEVLTDERIWTPEFMAKHNEAFKKYVNEHGTRLCWILLNAINERNPDKIYEIGKAVEFLKSFKETGDHYRYEILTLKSILDQNGQKWPIRALAKAIGWHDMKSQDGFARLRRLCGELRFPLASSRQISRK